MKNSLIAMVFLLPTLSATGSGLTPTIALLKYESLEHGVPFRLLYGICKHESRLNPNALNKYDGGSASRGLCQIKFATAQSMGFKGRPKDLFDPHNNAHIAAKLLAYQLKRYNGDWMKAVSAYNAGKAIAGNRSYIQKVLNFALSIKLGGE